MPNNEFPLNMLVLTLFPLIEYFKKIASYWKDWCNKKFD